MKTLFVIAAFALGLAAGLDLENFQTYQHHFKKVYRNRAEASERAAVFARNVEEIRAHNEKFLRGEVSYKKGINQFTDMTEKEYLAHVQGLPKFDENLKKKYPTDEAFVAVLRSYGPHIPDSFSWVAIGAVSSVKDQAQCGSCTAFAVTATMDTCFFKATGTVFDDLSEQFLVDCANNHHFGEWGAFGCSGAWPQAYFDYLETISGGRMQTEQSYPYTATDNQCRQTDQGWYMGAKQNKWVNVWNAKEEDVKSWIAMAGPVVTTIYAGSGFGSYSGGVLEAQDCCDQATDSSCSYRNNHAVAVVGYGSEGGLDYWLVKNSWGTWWGDSGYVKVKRGTGHCGMFGHSASGPTNCN